MKRLWWWWLTEINSTFACVFGFHTSCTGKGISRWDMDKDPLCWCRCHYKLQSAEEAAR